MPRPRFYKLAEDKRRALLDAAGAEFAAHGYEAASLNGILAATEISKGAFYYYFEDKADLFATVVEEIDEAQERVASLAPSELTRENFWPRLKQRMAMSLDELAVKPWLVDLGRAFHAIPERLREGRLAELSERVESHLVRYLERGQEVGVVRSDLPSGLLYKLVISLDRVFAEWLPGHLATLDEAGRRDLERTLVELVMRMLAADD